MFKRVVGRGFRNENNRVDKLETERLRVTREGWKAKNGNVNVGTAQMPKRGNFDNNISNDTGVRVEERR